MSEHLDLCTTQELCEEANLYRYNGTCHLKPAYTPNWQCSDWQPVPETQACGQTFSQTRTCTDLNNCGIEEGKPAEEQSAVGTNGEACGITSTYPIIEEPPAE